MLGVGRIISRGLLLLGIGGYMSLLGVGRINCFARYGRVVYLLGLRRGLSSNLWNEDDKKIKQMIKKDFLLHWPVSRRQCSCLGTKNDINFHFY